MTKQKTALINAADSIGQKIQYHSAGFLANRRQVILHFNPVSSNLSGESSNTQILFSYFSLIDH